ncbi:alpha/beta fold hydrolase [bacterium]|nr:alpha/beta fold hydrolase [bacterium]
MTERHRGFDIGRRDASRRILWIHGYTGSPDAFAGTAERLAHELDAHVLAPLLPGHGTEQHHLLNHSFDEFLSATRYFARTLTEGSKPTAFIGYSFGGYIAALLAQEFKPDALAIALTPYRLRLPFRLPGMSAILGMRSFWRKYLTAEDLRIRKGLFYYRDFPGRSLSLIQEGNRRLTSALPEIKSPILTLHTAGDPLAAPESGARIVAGNGNAADESHVLSGGRHALFFRPEHKEEERILIEFLKKNLQKKNAARE